ncbi:MAG: DUF6986 family protein [Acidobacteriota bacterium]
MEIKTSLTDSSLSAELARLERAHGEFSKRYPGESFRRQPVHTVYGGAHLFQSDTAPKLGKVALRALDEYAPDSAAFAGAISMTDGQHLAGVVYDRVREKLHREPVEDFRIDFEDGYGNRSDQEEDEHAVAAARQVARGLSAATLPPFLGIRIKPFTQQLRARSIRTLDLFLTALATETGARLPDGFVVTLPKVVIPEEPALLALIFEQLESATGLPGGSMKFELMIETTQAILGPRGVSNLPLLLEASAGRCVAAHFGTYDYTAGCGITAAHQHMAHGACDFALHMMQVAFAGTGIWLSDGSTNILPVAPHAAAKGASLTARQVEQNRDSVHSAWKLHYGHVRRSLANAYYQGWDLHPAQLPTRYAAVYSFFLEGLDAASARLRNFVQKAAQATLVGGVFDDAATGQGLLNFFLRAINCGAVAEQQVVEGTGLTLEELRLGSFVEILKSRG